MAAGNDIGSNNTLSKNTSSKNTSSKNTLSKDKPIGPAAHPPKDRLTDS